jgi:predicted heme/steroid binding protein
MRIRQLRVLFLILTVAAIQAGNSQTSTLPSGKTIDFKKFNSTSFGENVFVFDPSMDMKEIQIFIDTIFNRQSGRRSEFSKNRYALLFKTGNYNLDIKIGYYMQVLGLGASPEDVVITGAVRSNTTHGNSVLTNFWRGAENLTIIPATDSTNIWGVSQAAPLRRVHIKGNLQLFDKGYASGGFLADAIIDGVVTSGPQQQWFSRNTKWGKWSGGNWNMMFVGVPDAPAEDWPAKPFTTIKETPLIREKPYIVSDSKGYSVKIPLLKKNSIGPGWYDQKTSDKTLSVNEFYIARAGADNSESINNALKKGKNLIFTPGIYYLDKSIKVTRPGTVIMGIGMPSLMPVNGTTALEISDVDGITVCGITIDAGPIRSETLFMAGEPGSVKSHEADPTFLYDVFFRVGGPAEGSAKSCMVINSKNVCVDHIWLWRADHGNGVGWSKNMCANGLIVNGDNVTIYGLFNEHFQEYQTLWNGNNGRVYFYQSEMPYDPPTADSWKHDGINGYASYKVSDNVKNHEAWGVGIYNVFYNAPVIVDNAIETPGHLEEKIHHMIIFWLNGNKESIVKSIINGKGGPVNVTTRKATMK